MISEFAVRPSIALPSVRQSFRRWGCLPADALTFADILRYSRIISHVLRLLYIQQSAQRWSRLYNIIIKYVFSGQAFGLCGCFSDRVGLCCLSRCRAVAALVCFPLWLLSFVPSFVRSVPSVSFLRSFLRSFRPFRGWMDSCRNLRGGCFPFPFPFPFLQWSADRALIPIILVGIAQDLPRLRACIKRLPLLTMYIFIP